MIAELRKHDVKAAVCLMRGEGKFLVLSSVVGP